MDSAIAYAARRQSFVMQDDAARELYEMRQKAERDRRSELEFALEKGFLQGEEVGLRKGEQKGEKRNALQNARNALAKGLSHQLVHEITGVDMETIAGLAGRV